MFKKLIKFYKNSTGTVLILFGLLSPALLIGFAYMNNFAIWNELYQSTKGMSKAAAQSLGKQFFSQCVAQGNNIGNCTDADTAGTVATTIIENMVQTQINNNYNGMEYNIAANVSGAVNAQENFIQIPIIVTLNGFDDQLIAPALTNFPTDVEYEIQTVINLHFTETP